MGKYTRSNCSEILLRVRVQRHSPPGPVSLKADQMPFNRPIPESKQRGKIAGGIGAIVEAEKLMQIALLLPSAAVVGWLAGAFLDSRLHQSWIAIVGVVFGCISGLVFVIRMAFAAERDSRTGTKASDDAGKGSSNPQP